MLLPGAHIGILGDGQLGRMLALTARRMGYATVVAGTEPQGSAGQVADAFVRVAPGAWPDAVDALRGCDVVTVETDHVPATVLEQIGAVTPVRPGAHVLRALQDRLLQRQFLARCGVPQPAFAVIEAGHSAPPAFVFPAILKTRTAGYDGRGQARVAGPAEMDAAHVTLGRVPAVLESYVAFAREISVIVARTESGAMACFPIAENEHQAGVLRKSIVPARIDKGTTVRALKIATVIANSLRHVGVLAVELFVLADGALLVNEVAPRVHNSGHWSWEACATSQFEQHMRAVCDLPLGDTTLLRPAVLVNLFGEDLLQRPGFLAAVASNPFARLHLYGKSPPRHGRKMGHFAVVAESVEEAAGRVAAIESHANMHLE